MLKKIHAFLKSKKKEDGIALLFTLGILSLLLVMALAFAANSIVEQKTASNTNKREQARMLAQSAVNRTLAGMTLVAQNMGIYGSFENIKSYDATDKIHDWLCKLSTKIDGVSVYEFPVDEYDPNLPEAMHWQFAKDSSGRIIGRFAYIVLGDSGKVDPSAIVDSGVSVAAISEKEISRERPGVEISEIYMAGLNHPTTPATGELDSTDHNKLSVDNAAPTAGLLPSGSRWIDYDEIYTAIGADADNKQFIRDNFILKNAPDPEAYWIDVNSDSKKETTEFHHRFDLTRSDWNTITVGQLLCESGHEAQLFSVTDNTKINAAGIPFLRQICNVPGTFSTLEQRRHQIAANLIDYCDSNDIPTSDVAVADWLSSASNFNNTGTDTRPAYTGNERTFYINRVGGAGYLVFTTTTSGSGPVIHTTKISMVSRVCGELVNIYGNTTGYEVKSGNYTLKIYGTFSVQAEHNATEVNPATESVKFETTTPISFGTLNSGSAEYPFFWGVDDITTPEISLNRNGSYANLTNISAKLEITSAVLMLDGNPVDFAKLNPGATSFQSFYSGSPSSDSNTSASHVFNFYCQTEDPRQNLNTGDWSAFTFNNTIIPMPAAGSTTALTSIASRPSPATGPDTETATQSSAISSGSPRISTAFIRNAPMQSPWELGAIHRGAKWETINIKYYDNATTYKTNEVLSINGTRYAPTTIPVAVPWYNTDGGDAAILDQVKMTARTQIYGKIDINKRNLNVFRALFYRLYMNSDYTNPGAQSGTEVNDITANNFAIAYMGATPASTTHYRYDGSKDKTFTSRSQIASMQPFSSSGTNDAEKESIIGKFINLTKA